MSFVYLVRLRDELGGGMENRQQALYWAELVQLKIDCGYMRRYRDALAATVTRYTVIRAVVSVSALGTWAVVRSYPMVWGGIIAASQMAEALQTGMGYASRLRGATALCFALDTLFIDCLMEWEDIRAGKVQAEDITNRRHRLMTLRHDADRKHLPTPLPFRAELFELANAEARDYLDSLF
jgi:hypothetical protein